jgi:hypothetical protein
VADQLHPGPYSSGTFRNGLHSGAGALTGRKKSSPPVTAPPRNVATEEWVNEGGSLAPAAGEEASTRQQRPSASLSTEAHDTVVGCRDRAAEDRLKAASADTENSRRVLERSAASWEARAEEIQEGENGAAEQQVADRDLWASEEQEDSLPPD